MRLFLIGLGFVSLLAGAIGILLPLLPTTPFLLVAAWAFARSSPRLHDWLLENPRFGPIITQWRSHGVIPPRAKLAAVAALVATCGLSLLLGVSGGVFAIQLTVLSAVGVFVISRPGSAAASDARRSRARPGVR